MFKQWCLATGLLVGCGGDDGGGGGVDAPSGGGGCSITNDTCSGDQVCVGTSCVAAFPRVYAVSSLMVSVPTTDPGGAAWDVGGGAPDLFVTLSLNGAAVKTTPTVQDQFSATFAGPFDLSITAAGTTLGLDAFDEDATVDDPATGCTTPALSAANLRGHGFICQGNGNTISFRLDGK